MKKEIQIKTKTKNYPIIIENNSIIKYLKSEFRLKKNIFIIIDTRISKILKNFHTSKNVKIIKISGSEKIKSYKYFEKVTSKLLKLNIDRSSLLIAIGGGTIGDLTGFIASSILRGVNFTLIPTTLLAQVDSSIGGKNGINTIYGKNLIGTFFHPDKVILDPKILKTLSKLQIRSGYAEILKHSLIFDRTFFRWLQKNYSKVINLQKNYIEKAIIKSILIKSQFVQKDEKEKLNNSSSRAILNFGHTFGHALETMNNYSNKLTHGEAISIGMVAASKISFKMKDISSKEHLEIIEHLKKVKLPTYDKRIKKDKIYNFIKNDKKNRNEKINLILLKKIGQAYFKKNIDLKKIRTLLI